MSYSSDFPLCIIVITTYSDSVLSSRSVSLTNRLRLPLKFSVLLYVLSYLVRTPLGPSSRAGCNISISAGRAKTALARDTSWKSFIKKEWK